MARVNLRPTEADPDEDLVVRIGRGDPAATRAFVERKGPRMLALAKRLGVWVGGEVRS